MEPDLVRRVEKLEETVDSLRDLPARTASLEVRMGAVELQIVQLRTEMHDEFAAIRAEMATKADLAALREDMVATMASKADLEALRLEVREDIAGLGREMAARILESETRTRVLFEDVVGRIEKGREGRPAS